MTTAEQLPLLDVPESLSPFAAWKRTHKVWTIHNPDDAETPWMASGPFIGYGQTEQEACADMARISELPHWLTFTPANPPLAPVTHARTVKEVAQ